MTHEFSGGTEDESHSLVIQAQPDKDHIRLTHEHPDGKSSWVEMHEGEVQTLADILSLWLMERVDQNGLEAPDV